jgi:hypothetical protein
MISLFYINFLELSIYFAFGAFFLAFASQMNFMSIAKEKFWIFYTVVAVSLIFKNWMRYNGKRRHVLNAKLSSKKISIVLLWALPFGALLIAIALLQVR